MVVVQDNDSEEVHARNFGQVRKQTLALNISSLFGIRIKMAETAVKTALPEDGIPGILVTNADALYNEKEVYKRLKGIAGLPKVYELGVKNEVWMEWLKGQRLDEKYKEGGMNFNELKVYLQFASTLFTDAKAKGVVMYGLEPHNIMTHEGKLTAFDRGFDYVVDKPLEFFSKKSLYPEGIENQAVILALDSASACVIGAQTYNAKRIEYFGKEREFAQWVADQLSVHLGEGLNDLSRLFKDILSGEQKMSFEEFKVYAIALTADYDR